MIEKLPKNTTLMIYLACIQNCLKHKGEITKWQLLQIIEYTKRRLLQNNESYKTVKNPIVSVTNYRN